MVDCSWVCERPIQIRSAEPIANTAMTAQCDGPYAVNCRCAENGSINCTVSSNTIATGARVSTDLVYEFAGLDPQTRRALATTLRQASDTFAEVADGKTASHVRGVLAHLLDPP